jgi:tetratricopeptide (TPR) repeat protein
LIAERERTVLDPEARRLLSAYEKEQYAALLTEVDELSKVGPLSPGLLGVAGLSLNAMERFNEAAKAAGTALLQQPGWAWLHTVLAAAEAGQGHLPEALVAQRQAAQLLSGEPWYTTLLARYQRMSGQPEQAARTARQALLLDSAHSGALNELGLALLESGDATRALTHFREAQEAAPREAEAHLNEARLHHRAGDRSAERRALREALHRNPRLTEAEDLMALTLTGKSEPARKLLIHLLNLARVTVVGWLIISFFYYLLFRLMEFFWKWQPVTMPVGRAVLLITLCYVVGAMAIGHLLRSLFRRGWPR